ncbi:hypothetical protein [Novosphingobium sp.]|uniref:hypothetical protein n=1 Tax=Novosphingobium sp. TaxID=1874826 RepID=UPI0026163C88|nr:hypothetical protein [Novosphingobium sp.]
MRELSSSETNIVSGSGSEFGVNLYYMKIDDDIGGKFAFITPYGNSQISEALFYSHGSGIYISSTPQIKYDTSFVNSDWQPGDITVKSPLTHSQIIAAKHYADTMAEWYYYTGDTGIAASGFMKGLEKVAFFVSAGFALPPIAHSITDAMSQGLFNTIKDAGGLENYTKRVEYYIEHNN